MPLYYKHIIIMLMLFLVVNTETTTDTYFTLQTTQHKYVAGQSIVMQFKTNSKAEALLYCSGSYGSIVVSPKFENDILSYTIPKEITQKAGVVQWKLLQTTKIHSGTFKIQPQPKPVHIETYVGPPLINAGASNYAMLVAIPTDGLDNPLPNNTAVTLKQQFLNAITTKSLKTQHGFAAFTVNAPNTTGRLLLSTTAKGLNSKEFDIGVMPGAPTVFSITANRAHHYADGNQITILKTSPIKDGFNNIVSDGTFVTFVITDANGYKTKTFGSTINGVASAQIIHPDIKTTYTVKAFVDTVTAINVLTLNYKPAVLDYEVSFLNNNAAIVVSNLKSFMSQLVPDGLQVSLNLYLNDNLVQHIRNESVNGKTKFILNKNQYPSGYYTITVTAAGITKTFTNIKL